MEITEKNFEQEIEQSPQVVLLDFWAPWCGPCKMLEPVIEEISKELPDVKIGKVNVDEQSALSQRFSVMSMPTLLFMKDGKVMDQMVGVQPKEVIKSKLEELK